MNGDFTDACLEGKTELVTKLLKKIHENYIAERLIGNKKSKEEKHRILQAGLRYACREGHLEIVKLLLETGIKNLNEGLEDACENSHEEIIKLLVKTGADNLTRGLIGGCKSGNMKIVKLIINLGANRWDRGLEAACRHGYIKIVKLMIEKGANNYQSGISDACMGGNLKIVKLMIKNGAFISMAAFGYAGEYGHFRIVKFLIKNVKNVSSHYDCGLADTVNSNLEISRNYSRIVKLLVANKADINVVKNRRLFGSHDHPIGYEYMIEKGYFKCKITMKINQILISDLRKEFIKYVKYD